MEKEEKYLNIKSAELFFQSLAEEKRRHPYRTFFNKLRYRIEIIFDIPMGLVREIKWFYQRGTRGYSDRDLWSFDNYLADVISSGIKELSIDLEKSQQSYIKDVLYTLATAKKIANLEVHCIPLEAKDREKIVKQIKKSSVPLLSYKETVKYEKGFGSFGKIFLHLWT